MTRDPADPAGRGGGDGATAAWAVDVETHRVIDGRRWRVSDPRIPDPLRQALVDELMAARRAVKHAGGDAVAERAARDRVHDAKVALGERGVRWWEAARDADGEVDRIRRAHRVFTRLEVDDPVGSAAAVCSCDVDAVRTVVEVDR